MEDLLALSGSSLMVHYHFAIDYLFGRW